MILVGLVLKKIPAQLTITLQAPEEEKLTAINGNLFVEIIIKKKNRLKAKHFFFFVKEDNSIISIFYY